MILTPLALATALAVSTPAAPTLAVSADYGGYRYNNLGARWHRYDFDLTNQTQQPQQLLVCPGDFEVSIHDHRVQRESAFAMSLDGAQWSYGCTSRLIAPGETVRLGAFFREWWALESTTQRKLRVVEGTTSLGTFTMQFTPSGERGQRVVQVSSRT